MGARFRKNLDSKRSRTLIKLIFLHTSFQFQLAVVQKSCHPESLLFCFLIGWRTLETNSRGTSLVSGQHCVCLFVRQPYESCQFVLEVRFQEAAQVHLHWMLIGGAGLLFSGRLFDWSRHLSYELPLHTQTFTISTDPPAFYCSGSVPT